MTNPTADDLGESEAQDAQNSRLSCAGNHQCSKQCDRQCNLTSPDGLEQMLNLVEDLFILL
jgi:hypothetical protein